MSIKLCPEDVLIHIKANDCMDALHLLSTHLLNEGKVKPDYEEHLVSREREYPTGLCLGPINVAIPHTDYQYANTTQLAVATLEHPIEWHNMEDSDEVIEVSAIVLSLFDKPEHELETLQQLMNVLQNQELVAKIVSAESPQQIIQAFSSREK